MAIKSDSPLLIHNCLSRPKMPKNKSSSFMSILSVFRCKCMSRIWFLGWENSVFLCICYGREDVTAWLCTLPPKTNSGCNKQTHFTCLERRWRSNKSYSTQKDVISAFQWYMTSARSDRRTPAISHRKDVGTEDPQWRRWRNPTFLEILWCETWAVHPSACLWAIHSQSPNWRLTSFSKWVVPIWDVVRHVCTCAPDYLDIIGEWCFLNNANGCSGSLRRLLLS
jgi:hypothetical protein